MGLRTPDHRHRRRRLSRFVLDAIKVASASPPHHAPPKALVLMIPTQVRLSERIYSCNQEERSKSPNQASFPRGGGLGTTSGGAGGMRDERVGGGAWV